MSRIVKTESAPVAHPPSLRELLVGSLPTLAWFAAFLVIVGLFGPRVDQLLERMTRLKLGGVEFELQATKERFERAENAAIPDDGKRLRMDDNDRRRPGVVRRWAEMRMSERPLRLLLLQDKPAVARRLREPFVKLGINIDIGICSAEAESLLTRHYYDAVISDVDWSGCEGSEKYQQRGTAFFQHARENGFDRPTIFYVGKVRDDIPAGAVGITNNWYEVLHMVMDVVARRDAR